MELFGANEHIFPCAGIKVTILLFVDVHRLVSNTLAAPKDSRSPPPTPGTRVRARARARAGEPGGRACGLWKGRNGSPTARTRPGGAQRQGRGPPLPPHPPRRAGRASPEPTPPAALRAPHFSLPLQLSSYEKPGRDIKMLLFLHGAHSIKPRASLTELALLFC